jgi:hypothetical protein
MAVSGTGIQTTSKPGTVSSYWDEKIRRTQERDRKQKTALRQAGWEVLRFWDFEVKEFRLGSPGGYWTGEGLGGDVRRSRDRRST